MIWLLLENIWWLLENWKKSVDGKANYRFSSSLDFPSVLPLARTAAPNRELNRAFRITFVLGSGRAQMGFGPYFDKIFVYFRPDTTIVNKLS